MCAPPLPSPPPCSLWIQILWLTIMHCLSAATLLSLWLVYHVCVCVCVCVCIMYIYYVYIYIYTNIHIYICTDAHRYFVSLSLALTPCPSLGSYVPHKTTAAHEPLSTHEPLSAHEILSAVVPPIPRPPREQLCNRYCSNKQTHSQHHCWPRCRQRPANTCVLKNDP